MLLELAVAASLLIATIAVIRSCRDSIGRIEKAIEELSRATETQRRSNDRIRELTKKVAEANVLSDRIRQENLIRIKEYGLKIYEPDATAREHEHDRDECGVRY